MSVTIFITHVRILHNGSCANVDFWFQVNLEMQISFEFIVDIYNDPFQYHIIPNDF